MFHLQILDEIEFPYVGVYPPKRFGGSFWKIVRGVPCKCSKTLQLFSLYRFKENGYHEKSDLMFFSHPGWFAWVRSGDIFLSPDESRKDENGVT